MTEHPFIEDHSHRLPVDAYVDVQAGPILPGHNADISSICFSPESQYVVTADGQEVRVWHANQDGAWMLENCVKIPGEMLAFAPTGCQYAFSERFGGVQVWSCAGNHIAKLLEHDQGLDVSFSPAGTFLATGDNQGRLLLWDGASYDLQYTLQIISNESTGQPKPPIYKIAFSPDSAYVAFACEVKERKVQVWKLLQTKPNAVEMTFEWAVMTFDAKERIYDLVFSPDGQVLAVVTSKSRCVWLIDTHMWILIGKLVMPQQNTNPIALAFSPEGQYLAVAMDDGTLTIWSIEDQQIVTSFEAHPEKRADQTFAIGALAWSPNGRWIATGGKGRIYVPDPIYKYTVGQGDYTIKLWEVKMNVPRKD